MSKAIVAGSFDPITLGHQWIIERAVDMFDFVYIVIASNPLKKGMFDVLERQRLIYASVSPEALMKIRVDYLDSKTFTVAYAQMLGVTHIVRGLRNTTDFDYEHQINLINRAIAPGVETIYLMPPRELIEVSSSMVKSMVGIDGWETIVSKYVSEPVLSSLQDKVSKL